MSWPCCCKPPTINCTSCSSGCNTFILELGGIVAGTLPADFVPCDFGPPAPAPNGLMSEVVQFLNTSAFALDFCAGQLLNVCIWRFSICANGTGSVGGCLPFGCTGEIGNPQSCIRLIFSAHLYQPTESVSLADGSGCTAYSFTVPASTWSLVVTVNVHYDRGTVGVDAAAHDYNGIFRLDFTPAQPACASFSLVSLPYVDQNQCETIGGTSEAVMIDVSGATCEISCGDNLAAGQQFNNAFALGAFH